MSFFYTILSSFWFEAIIRLILGFLLAGFIGAERESVNKPAGFKTHSLIGVSAVLIMLCGEFLSNNYSVDASRIPAQLLSGIGFIGAGTILRDGFNVKGLTTASSLLAVTCIGLSIGAGFYIGGIIATVFVYIILSHSHNLFESLDHFTNVSLSVTVKDYTNTLLEIQKILDKYEINIKKIKNGQPDEENVTDLQLIFRYHKDVNINSVFTEISALENVTSLEEG
ncbi:MAG: MgtC/SapB family protein [Clostridia bacterium]